MYKTFKTVEDLVDWIRDNENIETLDTGEVTLKDWIELGNSAEKYKKDYGFATKDKLSLRKKLEEAEKRNAEVSEQFDLVNNELISLKESQSGDAQKALQEMSRKLSEKTVECNQYQTQFKEYEKKQSRIPELEKQIADYQSAQNRLTILEAVKKAAVKCKVPQHIIDDSDFARIVVDDFIIDETGNIFTKGENQQTVDNYVIAKQKEKPHWSAVTVAVGGEPIRAISEGGSMLDDHAALVAVL